MTDQTRTDLDPLLAPLAADQRALLQIIGDAVMATSTWPVYQFVQAKLDDLDYNIDAVFFRLPAITDGQLNYALARRDRAGTEKEPVKLTIAGMAHLPAFASTVDMFLRVVRELGTKRAEAAYEPTQVITVEVPGHQLIADLDLAGEPLVGLLPELLQSEPATWHGSHGINDYGWYMQPSTFVRRFRTVTDVNDYLTRMRAWIAPAAPVSAPQPVSALGLVAAFDYLDVVWQLRFGHKLVHVPSAERAAKLAFDVTTPAEFTDRLSALGEMFKGLDVPGTEVGTFDRLRSYLPSHLPAEAMTRVSTALDLLQKVIHLRNAGQHVDAARQAARALPAFGLTFPIANYQEAWWAVQAHVIAALDTIREEIRAATPAAPAWTSTRAPRQRPPRTAPPHSPGPLPVTPRPRPSPRTPRDQNATPAGTGSP